MNPHGAALGSSDPARAPRPPSRQRGAQIAGTQRASRQPPRAHRARFLGLARRLLPLLSSLSRVSPSGPEALHRCERTYQDVSESQDATSWPGTAAVRGHYAAACHQALKPCRADPVLGSSGALVQLGVQSAATGRGDAAVAPWRPGRWLPSSHGGPGPPEFRTCKCRCRGKQVAELLP